MLIVSDICLDKILPVITSRVNPPYSDVKESTCLPVTCFCFYCFFFRKCLHFRRLFVCTSTALSPFKVWSFLCWYKEHKNIHGFRCPTFIHMHVKSWLLIHRLDFYTNIRNFSISLSTLFRMQAHIVLPLMSMRSTIMYPYTRLRALPSFTQFWPVLHG